jgi:hypothetical protein
LNYEAPGDNKGYYIKSIEKKYMSTVEEGRAIKILFYE